MKSRFLRLKSRIIHYRDFKKLEKQKYIADIENVEFSFETDNDKYKLLSFSKHFFFNSQESCPI